MLLQTHKLVGPEGKMARKPNHPQWQVQRTTQEHPQALARWDQAYRRLLEWSAPGGSSNALAQRSGQPASRANPANPVSAEQQPVSQTGAENPAGQPGSASEEAPHE